MPDYNGKYGLDHTGKDDDPLEPGWQDSTQPIGPRDIEPVLDEPNSLYDGIDPVYTYTGSDFSLTYNNLIPFLGVYLVYKYLM
jgi:hypothetical protein